jgi:hypothetical protein
MHVVRFTFEFIGCAAIMIVFGTLIERLDAMLYGSERQIAQSRRMASSPARVLPRGWRTGSISNQVWSRR